MSGQSADNKIDYEHEEGAIDTAGKAGVGPRTFVALNYVNEHEHSLTYWEGIRRYEIALLLCFCVSLGAMLNGLDGSVSLLWGHAVIAALNTVSPDPRSNHLYPNFSRRLWPQGR